MASFREKLLQLYRDEANRFGKKRAVSEYQNMIRYGAMGDLEENHYLFLYRDIHRNSAYYGAIIFFNMPDEEGNPIRISCIEQNGNEKKRDIYIKAALYFLKKEHKNTMNLSGSVETVFDMAKEKIDFFMDRSKPDRDPFEEFDYDLAHQKIFVQEIKIKKVDRIFKNHILKENLELLKSPTLHKRTDSPEMKHGVPGLCLKVEIKDLTGKKSLNFHPLVLPLKKDGSLSKPRKFDPHVYETFQLDFVPIPLVVSDFFKLLRQDVEPGSRQAGKIKMLNQFYFDKLATAMLNSAMPKDLIFCQPEGIDKGFYPMEVHAFQKVEVRFAPCLHKESKFRFFLKLIVSKGRKKEVINIQDNYSINIMDQTCYLFCKSVEKGFIFARPQEQDQFLQLFRFLDAGNEFYLQDLDEIAAVFKAMGSSVIDARAKLLKKYVFTLLPTPVLRICENFKNDTNANPKGEYLEVEFDYTGEIEKFLEKNPTKEVYTYSEHQEFENACLALLKSDKMLKKVIGRDEKTKRVCYYFYFREKGFVDWLVQVGARYLEKGFKIYSKKWDRYMGKAGSVINVTLSPGIDWLEFKPMVLSEGSGDGEQIVDVDLDENTVTDSKGVLHLVTKAQIKKLARFLKYKDEKGVFRVPSNNYFLIRDLYDQRMEDLPGLPVVPGDWEKLEEFEKIPPFKVSSHFKGQLRDYQQKGFHWLHFLRDYGFSGCLADDMGLGKTVQTLALLQTLKDKGKLKTSLLVVPVSAIPNWESEIQRFSPALTSYRHQGAKRDKSIQSWQAIDMVITSYATLRNDIEIFKDFKFDYLVLDESQNIKNAQSGISRAAKLLQSKNRLALSGTPIENHSLELWSLFDFLLPGFLGSQRWFRFHFALPIERDKDQSKIDLLKRMISPFIMRRKKEEVERELPEKTEILARLSMDPEQEKLYAETAANFRKELDEQVDENAASQSALQVFEKMMRLRQLCLFPGMMNEKYKEVPSAKFEYFTGLLEDIIAEDHKVLVFSSFVKALSNIRLYLDNQSIKYSYIDGSVDVNKRKQEIKDFQEQEDRKVFLLSLKAGGVALNLTAADYVVIFDPWWNPAVEAQAIDRSHRIGQTRKVIVYKMVLENSIEEKMLELQDQKKALVEDLITSGAPSFRNLKKADILELFNFT